MSTETTNEKLIRELRGWYTLKGASCFRDAAVRLEQLQAFQTAIFSGCTNEMYCGPHPHDLWESIEATSTPKGAL